jgi:hypothetical protein
MATVQKQRTQAKIEVPAGETSDIYEWFDDIATIVITFSFPNGSGSGKVQTTTSLREDLEAGNAVWMDWTNGEVTTLTQDSAVAPNAIRVVNTGSEPVLVEVRGNYA